MKTIAIAVFAVLALASAGSGEEVVARYTWDAAHTAPQVQVLPPDREAAFARIKVLPQPGVPTPVLVIDQPRITGARYGLRGQVRYEGVEGEGYLEMWNVFPSDKRFFSRTLAQEGPLQSLRGSSGWRPFLLPFFNEPGAASPTRLEVNVVLPGKGAVFLGPLELVQFGPAENPLQASWTSDRRAGVLGAVLGSLLGLAGAVTGWLGGRGRAPRFVLGLLKTEVAFGALLIVVGLVALARSEPAGTVYVFVLSGVIAVGVALPALRTLSRRYQEDELRRMTALDTR